MKGIDVSSNQGNIDLAKVKASGVEIVYIKATQGTGYINSMMTTHYKDAKANGLKVGFYHYLTHDAVIVQAQYFLNTIDGLEADCKFAIDVEGTWAISEASVATRMFADYLISKGKEPAIYTGDYFYRDNLNSSVKDISLWVANYGGNILANCYVGPQYSETGRVEGINGNVDLDNFNNAILLKTEAKESVIQGVKLVKNLVVVGNSVDKRAGEYLADYFQCPIIDGVLPFDYSVVENVYCVGGQPGLPFTSFAKKIITGSDRYDTAQQVLNFIKNGGK